MKSSVAAGDLYYEISPSSAKLIYPEFNDASVKKNIPIIALLILSAIIHGAVLLWPAPTSTAMTPALQASTDIKVNLNRLTTDDSEIDKQSRPVQNSLPEIAKAQIASHSVKTVKPLKAAASKVPAKKQRAKPTHAVHTVNTIPEAVPVPEVNQTQTTDYDTQRLKLRIQQLIKLRVRHNQHYPRLARKRAWEGQVKLGMQVRSDGQLTGIHVIASSGHRVLDKAAIKSVSVVTHLPEAREWLQGHSIDVILPIIYQLTDS